MNTEKLQKGGAKIAKSGAESSVRRSRMTPAAQDSNAGSDPESLSDDEYDEEEEEGEVRQQEIKESVDDKQSPVRRRGAKNEANLYSVDEEQALLRFYNIKTLNVHEWDLNPLEIGTELLMATMNSPATPEAAAALDSEYPIQAGRSRHHKGRVGPGVNLVSVKNIDSTDPLGIKQSIFGKTRPLTVDMDIYQKILVANKNFDPKTFLKAVHSSTSYAEITNIGARSLQQSIDKRAEVMKDLVKQHFAKFVNAKSTIDSFYEEMKTNNLISSEEKGFAPFTKSLDELSASAKNLYGPMIERKEKADKIRLALSLLDQWKFFFNLPSSLLDSIKKEKYDAAVRDYNKGKYLMTSSFSTGINEEPTPATPVASTQQSRPPTDPKSKSTLEIPETPTAHAPSTNAPDSTTSSLLPEAYRDVFQHVWKEVENITDGFRKKLFHDLRNPDQSLDVQERVLRYLVDLSPEQDPVWFYLNNRYETIMNQLTDEYEAHWSRMEELHHSYQETLMSPSAAIPLPKPSYIGYEPEIKSGSRSELKKSQPRLTGENDETVSNNSRNSRTQLRGGVYGSLFSTLDGSLIIRKTERLTIQQLRKALGSVNSKEFENVFVEEYDLQAWKSSTKFVRNLSKILTNTMQDFWRLCKIFSEERIQKTPTNSPSTPLPKQKRRADVKKMMLCHTMIRHIVEHYSTLLGNCFHVQSSLSELKQSAQPSNAPPSDETGADSVSVPPKNAENNIGNIIGSPKEAVRTSTAKATSTESVSEKPHSSGSSLFLSKQIATYMDSLSHIPSPQHSSPPPKQHGWFLSCSNPLMASHWAAKVVKELAHCYEEVRGFHVGGGTLIEEKETEDLTKDATQTIKLYYRFVKSVLTSLHKISSASVMSQLPPPTESNSFEHQPPAMTAFLIFGTHGDTAISTSSGGGNPKHTATIGFHYDPPAASSTITQDVMDKVIASITTSVCELLDGLEWLATRWVTGNALGSTATDSSASLVIWDERRLEELMLPPHKKFHGETIGGMAGGLAGDESGTSSMGKKKLAGVEKRGKVVDTKKSEPRSLVVLCNISYVRRTMIPKVVALLETKFKCRIAGDVNYLNETGLVRSGVLYSGLDWNELKRPVEIRPYIHEILMNLVMTHAEVSDISQSLVKYAISTLLRCIALDLLAAFRGVDTFSEMGAMQATLETEFIHQTLSMYETPQIAEVFGLIYSSIQNGTSKPVDATSSPSLSEEGVSLVKEHLAPMYSSPPLKPMDSSTIPQTSPGQAVLEAAMEQSDAVPTLTHLTKESYEKMMWKNGLGSTDEIAIFPKNVDFNKGEFVWRFSLTEVRDACSFSVFPGYDIAMLMLPSLGNSDQKVQPPNIRHSFGGANAILRHNDQETPVQFRPLVPYTYAGELPTTCFVKGAFKHLTFIANRAKAQVTVSLETICTHGLSDEGICDGEGDVSTPIPSPMNNRTRESSPVRTGLDHLTAGVGPVDRAPSPSRHQPNAMPTNKILLGAATIVFVVSGSIRVSVNGDKKTTRVNAGETLICERDENSAPADFTMSPVTTNDKAAAGNLNGNQDALIYIIQIHLKHDALPNKRDSLYNDLRSSTQFFGPTTESTFNLNASMSPNGIPLPPGVAPIPRPLRERRGSIIIYDDPATTEKSPQPAAGSMAHGVKYWESAHHYRPPTFSARYQNESDVPPPVVRDSLVIEEFPMGKISTVWINMVKQGLSEWVRVPVIVARGVNPGPVLGITAVVHGNELNGVPCIHRVITDIDVHKLNGTVVAVPCVNVPGYLKFSREFSDGKDLNRLFPGSETGTASQIYAHAIVNKIATHFDYLIDLHTASFGRCNSYYVRSDLNDPVSAALAKLQQPQIILHNSGQDGTLRSACSARGITAITVEIGNPQLFQNQYVQWSYMGVMRILTYLGMFPPLESEPPIGVDDHNWMDSETLVQRVANLNMGAGEEDSKPVLYHQPPNTIICSKGFWIYTKTGGVLEVYPAVNTVIRKGDLIARIKNIFGNIVDEIFSPSSGVTIGRSSNPVAMAGDRVLHLGVIRKENEVLQTVAKENY
ncbi:hypothetical protein HDU98_009721 [Podochytrium sp. JEL0797]|nr:hypothetical protein HDU98_009721 [Podochytrium sp. JEL0797]